MYKCNNCLFRSKEYGLILLLKTTQQLNLPYDFIAIFVTPQEKH